MLKAPLNPTSQPQCLIGFQGYLPPVVIVLVGTGIQFQLIYTWGMVVVVIVIFLSLFSSKLLSRLAVLNSVRCWTQLLVLCHCHFPMSCFLYFADWNLQSPWLLIWFLGCHSTFLLTVDTVAYIDTWCKSELHFYLLVWPILNAFTYSLRIVASSDFSNCG